MKCILCIVKFYDVHLENNVPDENISNTIFFYDFTVCGTWDGQIHGALR